MWRAEVFVFVEVNMRKIVLIAAALILLATAAQCEQRYNAMTGKWETVPDSSDWQNRYNPMDGTWSYQPAEARTEYNPFEGTWDWNSGHNPDDE